MTDEAVRVEVVRRGGFAGTVHTMVLDTTELSAEDAAQLRELTDSAQLRFRIAAPNPTAHLFSYQLTVCRAGQRRRRRYSEASMPPGVRELVEFVCTRG